MPGPYSSLMVLRRRASRSGAGRAVRERKSRDNADGALIRLFTSNKAYRTRRDAARAVGTRDFVRSAWGSRRDIVSLTTWADFLAWDSTRNTREKAGQNHVFPQGEAKG